MTQVNKEEVIYRIVSKEHKISIKGTDYKIVCPSNEIRLQSMDLYNYILKSNRFSPFYLTDKQCLALLVKNKLCSLDIDKNLKEMEKTIENAKVDLYKSALNLELCEKNRKKLKLLKAKFLDMMNKRHLFDHLTLKGFAEMVKRQFIIKETLYYLNGSKVWDNEEDIDVFLLEHIANKILSESISQTDIREIARTEPWRTYWSIKKTGVFGDDVFNLTEEQKSLILLSKMYDSVFEHPESPTNEIINDDDMLDGWLVSQQREREKEKMSKQIDDKLKKNKSGREADEVFLVANSEEQFDKINSMNDSQAQIIKKQREAVIKRDGKVTDSKFLDRKNQIQQQSNRQFIQSVKGK